MFRTVEDFTARFRQESTATGKVLGALTDASLATPVAEDHRTLGRVAWHVVQTIPEMMGKVGLAVEGPGEEEPVPAAAADIASAYERAAAALLVQLEEGWTDETLAVTDEMYGQSWSRSFTLTAFVFHEVHHRAQMTVLMRQAGLRVPGIYGPAREEWGEYGMEIPAI